MAERPIVAHFFVDEAGDPTLFNKDGAVIVGHEGVSNLFMLGVARIPDPVAAAASLDGLRRSLLADPYFAGVPSMQPDAGKTARYFHAKNDVPEVRREVFKLLPSIGAEVQIAFRRKRALVDEARALFRRGLKLSHNDIYDDLVHRTFKDLLRPHLVPLITFARRGKTDRLQALRNALQSETGPRASKTYAVEVQVRTQKEIDDLIKLVFLDTKAEASMQGVQATFPDDQPCLQVIDYYLWAVQRMLERGEDRFFRLLESDYRLVMDLDDTRHQPYGEWYSASNPLTIEKILPVTG